GDVADADMRAELSHYLTTLEEANQRLVPEYAQAKDAYDAALRAMKEREEELRKPAAEPPAPAEDDVLPLGLALRAQLLERYVAPALVPAAPVPEGEAWEVASAAFRAAEAEPKREPPKPPAARPPKPKKQP